MYLRHAVNKVGIKTMVLAIASAISITGSFSAEAAPNYSYNQSISIPGAATFSGYDLSTFGNSNQLYYLTDRTNNAIDVFTSKNNSYVGRIGQGLFAGSQGGNNDIAGPNGLTLGNSPAGTLLIAGNGPSDFITFRLDSSGRNSVGTPRITSTAVPGTPVPPNRVDGVAYAPTTNTILAANNASNPGFLTLVNNANGQVIRSIQLNGKNGTPNVGDNGVEATIFNTARSTFFVAVPSFNPEGTGAGGVLEINPATGQILHTYDFSAMGLAGVCSPTGMSQGAGTSMLVACSDPAAGHSVLLDPTGKGSLRLVNGISGGDQTAYDPTNNTFFEAARFQPGGPVLGIIDAATLGLQTLAIGNNDHSVAVDPVTNEVFVASGPTTAFTNCSRGCIGVFAPTSVPEPGSLSLMALAAAGLGWVRTRRKSKQQ